MLPPCGPGRLYTVLLRGCGVLTDTYLTGGNVRPGHCVHVTIQGRNSGTGFVGTVGSVVTWECGSK